MRKPELREFDLFEESISQISNFNRDQEKRAWKAVHLFVIFVGIIATSFLGWKSIWLVLSVYATFLVFLLHRLANMWFFPQNARTKNLEKYFQKLKEFDLYQRKLKEDYWFSISGHQFEAEIAKILKPFFKEVTLTKGSGDGGVDIIIDGHDDERIIVQCKAHKKPVGPEPVRALTGVMKRFKASSAVFICLGGFTRGAKDAAQYDDVFIMDINDVIKMHEDSDSHQIQFAEKSIRIHTNPHTSKELF